MSLHETEAFLVNWCIVLDVGNARAIHINVIVIPSFSISIVPASVVPIFVRLHHFAVNYVYKLISDS